MQQTCPNCGSENYDFARFCRKCGFRLSNEEFHEAPTRGFDHKRPEAPPFAPPEEVAPARYVPPSGPGYAPESRYGATMRPGPPGTSPMPPVRIERKGGTNWLMIVGVILLLVVVGGGAIGFVIAKRISDAVASSPGGGGPGFPTVQVQEGGNIDPESLPAELQPFYYPGSDIKQSVSGSVMGMGGSVLIMTSDDDRADIEEHYKEIFGDAQGKREIRDGDETVLGAGTTNVVIQPSDENAELMQIVVALGKGSGIGIPDGTPQVPTVPPVGPVPSPPSTPATPGPPPPAPPK